MIPGTGPDLPYLLALLNVPGVGAILAKNLLSHGGSARGVFEKPRGQLLKVPQVGPSVVKALQHPAQHLEKAHAELAWCSENAVEVLAYTDPRYPERLKTIHDAPVVLFARGDLQALQEPTVAVVGTRKPTPYGRRQAQRFSLALVEAGAHVASGLALGIDGVVHQQVLEAGGRTSAVVAHGLDRVYPPQHRELAASLQQRGVLLSEHPHGTKPSALHFPARNRIIAGMAQATLVVEAGAKGGALITARLAFEQNRDVFAIPGDLGRAASVGCNHLIRDHVAQLVASPADLLDHLKLDRPSPRPFKALHQPLTADEQRVLNALDEHGLVLDDLALRLNLPGHVAMPVLLALEVKGLVEQRPGRKFARV